MIPLKSTFFGVLCMIWCSYSHSKVPASKTDSLVSPTEIKLFFDSFFTSEMPINKIPGAVLVFVQGDSIGYQQGYGYASLEEKIPVDPGQTVFRIASISKLLTATAVLQMVETGKIDIDSDVNRYIDFKVGNPKYGPIKVGHLLSHRAGLDERFIHWASYLKKDIIPLEKYLKNYFPSQINPSGVNYAYSNNGYALLGYLVETLTTQSFSSYVRDYILEPLQMHHSGFDDPSKLVDKLSTGYKFVNGQYQSVPYLFYNGGPAASFLSTAEDMAHFMIAQLNRGAYGGNRILQGSTADLMQNQYFTNHPRQPGTALGLWSSVENNLHTLEHVGDTPGYSSLFFMVPSHRLGLFVCLTNNSFLFREKLVYHFMNYLFPVANEQLEVTNAIADYPLDRFTGQYSGPFYAEKTIEKLPKLFVQFNIEAQANELKLTYPIGLSEPSLWKPVDNLIFKQVGGDDYLVFETNSSGQVEKMFIEPSRYPPFTLKKLSWIEYDKVQLLIFASFLLVFTTLFIISWFGGFKRFLAQLPDGSSTSNHFQLPLTRWGSLSNIICVMGVFLLVAQVYTNFATSKTIIIGLYALLTIPYLHLLITVYNGYICLRHLKSKSRSIGYKVYQLTYTLISGLFLILLYHWNFMGFRI